MSVHSHAAAQKSSGAFFSVWDRERCRKSAGRGRNAFRPSEKVRATDVMVNGVADSSIKKCHNTIFMI